MERAEDGLYMLYTGGTTGMPKGVMYDVGAFTAALMLGYPIHGVPVPETADQVLPYAQQIHELGKYAGKEMELGEEGSETTHGGV